MAGFTDYLEQKLLDHLFTDPAYTPPATLYVALSSTTPTEAGGNITEPSGGSYGRVATAAADWSAASGTAPAVKTNTATITFPTATADWVSAANLTYFVLYDASTVGNALAFGALTVPKPVLNGDTPSFPASALAIKLGDPGDTY
jgi:hypothetical protein